MYPYLAARLFDTPLLAHPGKAAAVAEALAPRLLGLPAAAMAAPRLGHTARARQLMGELGDPLEERVPDIYALYRIGAVAVISVEGTLVHKGKWIGANSGETSYEGLRRQINAAMADMSVRGVVFEVDSCGGEVSGAFDVAEAAYELSQAKPTISILTDCAYSAGYLIAAAARQVVLPETGGAGSIGVVALHADYSKAQDMAGIKVTVLEAGVHKAEGNPFQPLPDSVAEAWISEMESTRQIFAKTVSRFRGSRLSYEAAMATEAQCYSGEAAVAAGLADAVARPSEAFAAFLTEIEGG